MRKELELIEQIENYLMGKLEENEHVSFEKRINESKTLQEKVGIQKNIIEGIRRMGLKKSAQNAKVKFRSQRFFKKLLIGVIIAAGLLIAAYVVSNGVNFNSGENKEDKSEIIAQVISFPDDDSLAANANQFLDQEMFKINTGHDTLIESEDGLFVFIEKNTFDTDEDEVDFMIQTALKTEDVLKSGLSTTSNGQPLETGGMFYLDAFDDEGRVPLMKNLHINVPTDQKKADMKLFKGEVDQDGEVNWVNPEEIVSYLNPVDILTLDFYPPGYENKLNEMELYGKTFRDSLYYSFAYEDDVLNECEKRMLKGMPSRKMTPPERDFLYGDNRPIDKMITYEEAVRLCEAGLMYEVSEIVYGDPKIGKELFGANCASCHYPHKDMTGPALKGARERWIENSTEENFYFWIKNSQGVIKSGDVYANNIFDKWQKSVMTDQSISNEQIDHIFAYVENVLPNVMEETLVTGLDDLLNAGVNPASVQTIWTERFNGSLLATKEFEQRMPWIHHTCDDEILKMYIKNSNRELWYCDMEAARMTSGSVSKKFQEFADLKDGRVMTSPASEALWKHFERKRKRAIEKISQQQKEYWNKQSTQDSKSETQHLDSDFRSGQNQGEILGNEIMFNLKNTYERLDLKMEMPLSYNVTVSGLGWNNIDRKVIELTIARESGSVVANGKTAEIVYEEWSAKVNNVNDYDRVYVYNIPKTFSSYIKLNAENGTYNYKLNADVDYQTLVLGWNEDNIYFHQDKKTQPGEYFISLKAITMDEFKYNVAASLKQISNMSDEMSFIESQQKDQRRINKNVNLIKLRDSIEPIVFPCKVMDDSAVFPAAPGMPSGG